MTKMTKEIEQSIKKDPKNFKNYFVALGGIRSKNLMKVKKKLNYKKYSISISKFLKNHNSKIIFMT